LGPTKSLTKEALDAVGAYFVRTLIYPKKEANGGK